jgi:DNA repair exonuclease SbcCD nuclease subunit
MKRTRKVRKARVADAILISDLHLTDKTPVSRMDDYIEAQKRKLEFLKKLSKENNNCLILCAGDVFDYWKATPWLCSFAYKYLPEPFICIPGQHDLPGHSLDEYPKSALGLMDSVGKVCVINDWRKPIIGNNLFIVGVPYGKLDEFDPKEITFPKRKRKILLLHTLIWLDKRPTWSKGDYTANEILGRYAEYFDLILTGDNHQRFISLKNKTTILINPGSVMRITADQANFQPRCFLYYAEDNTVKDIDFPIQKNVVTREHIEEKAQKDERIQAYIERMNKDFEMGLSFRRNLEIFFEENNVPKKVREIIWKAMERID